MKLTSVFWKLFLSIWLTNILVTLLASHIVLSTRETRHFHERYEASIHRAANRVIEHVESGLQVPPKRIKSSLKRQRPRLPPMRLYQNGQIIFSYKGKHTHWPDTLAKKTYYQADIYSGSGIKYTIDALRKPAPKFIYNAFKSFNSLHIVFALFASAILSFIITLNFIRPIRALGHYSRAFVSEKPNHIAASILKRRDEIGDLARDIHGMTTEVMQYEKAQTQLRHDISHELRAPLARLQAAAAILEQKNAPSAELERIHKESEYISALIQKILDFSRLENQNEPKENTDILRMLSDIIEDIHFLHPKRSLSVESHLNQSQLYLYRDLMACALENILLNACKYTPIDAPIEIMLTEFDHTISIDIRDYGDGLSGNDIDDVTLPFYRQPSQTRQAGFGLGFSIAKRAVEKHKGQFKIKNHHTKGLVVSLMLPRE